MIEHLYSPIISLSSNAIFGYSTPKWRKYFNFFKLQTKSGKKQIQQKERGKKRNGRMKNIIYAQRRSNNNRGTKKMKVSPFAGESRWATWAAWALLVSFRAQSQARRVE